MQGGGLSDPANQTTTATIGEAPSPPRRRVFQQLDRTAAFPYRLSDYARRFLWAAVRMTLFDWSPTRAFRWRAAILRAFGAKVAARSAVRPSCYIFHPWLLELGDMCAIAEGVIIYNLGPVSIGDHTVISQRAHLCAGTHDYTRANLPLLRPPIRIGSGVWVAAEAFIGPGVTIGDNSVVGARAVVTKDVPPGVVVGGNPARVIKPREMHWDEDADDGGETDAG
jgi:putative colanic acid biosynthesis acetyltransferase WcaF